MGALTSEVQSRADIARAAGREPKDRSVGRVLDDLEREGKAERAEGGWRGVAGGTGPIGSRHPATPGENPHGEAKNGGGKQPASLEGLPPSRNGWSAEVADPFLERAKQVFPGSYELSSGGSG